MKIIAFIVFTITYLFTFNYWISSATEANKLCAKVNTYSAVKWGHGSNGHNRSKEGTDVSCYVSVFRNGHTENWEFWNIGDCEDKTPIAVQITDYCQ